MTWAARFVPVPTQLLQVEDLNPSAKVSDAELREYARNLRDINQLVEAGLTREDFESMQRAALNPHEESIAQSYQHFFIQRPTSQHIEADYIEGRGLVVTRGRHRVNAAREMGVAVVPVVVRCEREADAEKIQRVLTEDLGAQHPRLEAHYRHIQRERGENQGQQPHHRRTPIPERSIEIVRDRER